MARVGKTDHGDLKMNDFLKPIDASAAFVLSGADRGAPDSNTEIENIMTNGFVMRRGVRMTLLLAALIGATAASAAEVLSDGHVFGYQDSKTGGFHALTAVVPDAASPTTGTVHVTFNIKLSTTFPKGTVLNCNLDLAGSSVSTTTGTATTYQESVTESVAISGTTATCTAVIPYSWLVAPASGTVIDSFSGSYSVNVSADTAAAGATSRSSSSNVFTSTKIPASGTTSTYTVNVTL